MAPPAFLIIGSMKSGTTSLYDALAETKGFHLPEEKEPDILHQFPEVETCRLAYARHFGPQAEGTLCGEASTSYTMRPFRDDVARHAHAVCGTNLKLIMIMRDPVQRIVSHLRHDYLVGRVQDPDFDRLVREDGRYIAFSDYGMQLDPWVSVFGRSNLLCLDLADFSRSPREVTQRVVDFVGGSPDGVPEMTKKRNAHEDLVAVRYGFVKPLITNHTYRYVMRRLLPERMRNAIKQAVVTKRQPVDVQLSSATVAEIQSRLSDMPDRVEALTGCTFDWPSFRPRAPASLSR